jgi:hypothetical protein
LLKDDDSISRTKEVLETAVGIFNRAVGDKLPPVEISVFLKSASGTEVH